MAIGRTNAGGGTSLNFKVVGGTTAPASPKENTIWVNTAVSISSWAFSATEPVGPVEGMVWVKTATNSSGAFNALKKNDIQVYPLNAQQYVSGQWEIVEAKSYRGGAWVNWFTPLYYLGDECESTTGGWETLPYATSAATKTKKAPTLTKNDASMTISQNSTSVGTVWSVETIDLTDYETLVVNVAESSNSSSIAIGIATEKKDSYTFAARTSVTVAGEYKLDVSEFTGEHYVVISLAMAKDITIDKMWLK